MSFWAAAQTIAQREQPVAARLSRIGYPVLAPQGRFRIDGQMRITAVFPGYVFLKIINSWWTARFTEGVLRLIMSGDGPAKVPEFEIQKIIQQTGPNGLVRIPKQPPTPPRTLIREGAVVRILSGSFRGISGVYAGMSPNDRQRVLLDLLGRKCRVELASDDRIETTCKIVLFNQK
jgi:transcription antitermination factor NusG